MSSIEFTPKTEYARHTAEASRLKRLGAVVSAVAVMAGGYFFNEKAQAEHAKNIDIQKADIEEKIEDKEILFRKTKTGKTRVIWQVPGGGRTRTFAASVNYPGSDAAELVHEIQENNPNKNVNILHPADKLNLTNTSVGQLALEVKAEMDAASNTEDS